MFAWDDESAEWSPWKSRAEEEVPAKLAATAPDKPKELKETLVIRRPAVLAPTVLQTDAATKHHVQSDLDDAPSNRIGPGQQQQVIEGCEADGGGHTWSEGQNVDPVQELIGPSPVRRWGTRGRAQTPLQGPRMHGSGIGRGTSMGFFAQQRKPLHDKGERAQSAQGDRAPASIQFLPSPAPLPWHGAASLGHALGIAHTQLNLGGSLAVAGAGSSYDRAMVTSMNWQAAAPPLIRKQFHTTKKLHGIPLPTGPARVRKLGAGFSAAGYRTGTPNRRR